MVPIYHLFFVSPYVLHLFECNASFFPRSLLPKVDPHITIEYRNHDFFFFLDAMKSRPSCYNRGRITIE